MNFKNLSGIFFIGLTVVILAGCVKQDESDQAPDQPTAIPIVSEVVKPDPNLITYTNKIYTYSFDYPSYLTLEEFEEKDAGGFLTAEYSEELMYSPSMVFKTIKLDAELKDLTLKEFVSEHGSYINYCHKDTAKSVEKVTTDYEVTGYRVEYWLVDGCQGAGVGETNDPQTFFSHPDQEGIVIDFYSGQLEKVTDDIVQTFRFH